MAWIRWTGIGLALLVTAWVVLAAYGASRWNTLTRELTARLESARVPPRPATYDARELEGLPPPVQRYFRAVLNDGQAVVTAASVEHTGTFNMGETGDQWKPFTSTQRVVTRRPGFVWDGRIAMLPGLAVHVHDAYVAGEGILHPAILGLFTLIDLRGTGDVAQGELMRFFVEASWYPTALLPSQGVQWEPVDEHSAKATLKDLGLSLTMLFRFNDDNLIASARSEARGRTVAGKIIQTPWEGRWLSYEVRDDMRVPTEGEVAWLLPEGPKPYWRGRITRLEYEFANGLSVNRTADRKMING